MSLFETINHGEHIYFDSAVMLMFFLLIGRYLDFSARKKARSSATDLLSSLHGFATVIKNNKSTKVLIRDLKEGMIVQVVMGEKFPVDGVIIEGKTTIDTSFITGETVPRDVYTGNDIYAGTINLSTSVLVRVVKAAGDSLLADIVRLMERAGQGQAAYVKIADKAASLYTPVVHSFAIIAFIGWFFIAGLPWQESLMISITVLIITCPCALGLAVPVVQVLATGRLMKLGILVKSGDALERLASIDTILFDKTGTLTLGHPQLEGTYNNEDIKLAASLANYSRHPLSQALLNSYEGELLNVTDVKEYVGEGLEAIYNLKNIKIGSRKWCGDQQTADSDRLELWLNVDGQKKVFYFIDQLKNDSKETIKALNSYKLTSIMLSGDRQSVANNIASKCGIEEIYAEKTPVEKFEILEKFKQKGHKVLMVGDGLNDAPVLSGADVSMAPGTAVDMAQNAADIIFMGTLLSPVKEAYRVAHKTQNLVKQNFMLAVLYNIIAVPLALFGLVTPLIAALAMSGSSLLVITNSFRVKFFS
jgi:Cu2+-exporting ATPase